MKEYEDMDYFALKSLCSKKLNINSKGTKEELLERIKNTKFPNPIEEQEIKAPKPEGKIIEIENPQGESVLTEEAGKEIKEDKAISASPYLPQGETLVNDQKYSAWLSNKRLESLSNQLLPVSAGKGKFKFIIDRRTKEFQVEFSGKVQGLCSTTLIDTDKRIVQEAGYYFNAKYAIGKNNQVRTFK